MSNINLNEEIASVRWTMEDIKWLFEENNIKFTEENIEIFFDRNKVSGIIEDSSISQGWEALQDMLYQCKNELEKVNDYE